MYPVYLEVRPHGAAQTTGPITVPEVRLELYDDCPEANYLLDELEFTDAEIIHCMRKCIDEWNDALPPVGYYSYQNFPFRSAWLKATSAHLLNMVANKYRRNMLKYSAGGISISDQDRWKEYQDRARELLQEWYLWVKNRKISINVDLCNKYIGSEYGNF